MKFNKLRSILLLVILIVVGCNRGGEQSTKIPKSSIKKKEVKAPKKQPAQPVKLDKFGRSPGHPHYGHNHSVGGHGAQNVDSTQKPAEGKPDKYGRKPGDPHYMHNHK